MKFKYSTNEIDKLERNIVWLHKNISPCTAKENRMPEGEGWNIITYRDMYGYPMGYAIEIDEDLLDSKTITMCAMILS